MALATVVLVACGSGSSSPDAGQDAASAPDAALPVPAPPAPPSPTTLRPCPAGWREVDDGSGLVTCDPWPAGGRRADCGYDEAHFVGEASCARIGTACAADGWPSDLPAGRAVVYVDDGAAPGGDGATRARAFATVAAAVTAAPDGAVIAIATGDYDEDLVLSRGLELWGACVSGTRLTSSRATDADVGALELGAGCGARNLAMDSAERNGIVVRGGGATLDDVLVHAARIDGIWAPAGSLVAHSIIVRDMRPSSAGLFGRGLETNAVHVVLSRAVVEGGTDIGLIATRASGWLEAQDVAVEGVLSDAHGMFGGGAYAYNGGRLTILRGAFEGNQNVGLTADANSVGGGLEATDVVVRGTLARVDGTQGRGVQGVFGASVTLTRVLVEHSFATGVLIGNPGTHLAATSLVVRDTRAAPADPGNGGGVGIEFSAGADIVGLVVEASQSYGLFVDGNGSPGGEVHIADAVIRDTASSPDGTTGEGVHVQWGSHLVLERALLERNREVGLFAVHGGLVDASDLVVRDTGQSGAGLDGFGIYADGEASSITLGRARVEGSRVVGIGAVLGGAVHASDLVVAGVTHGCLEAGCPTPAGGFGVAGQFGGILTADHFAIDTTDLCGVVVGQPGTAPVSVDLSDGSITTVAVGACVQVDGYDSTRLRNRVRYVDVGIPLQATSYALPDAIPGP